MQQIFIAFITILLLFAIESGIGCGVKKPPIPPLVEKKSAMDQQREDEVRKKGRENPREVRENERNRK
ncbi:MAG: hypothetical protein HY391_04055 [Deltaproteobacteria bacterium]|nr:hypothetical protein [Deltaproteobacteria bacterium]